MVKIYLPDVVMESVLYVEGTQVKAPVKSFTLPGMELNTTESNCGPYSISVPGKLKEPGDLTVTFGGDAVEVAKKRGQVTKLTSYRLTAAIRRAGEPARKIEVSFRAIAKSEGQSQKIGDEGDCGFGFHTVMNYSEVRSNELVASINYLQGKVFLGDVDQYGDVMSVLE